MHSVLVSIVLYISAACTLLIMSTFLFVHTYNIHPPVRHFVYMQRCVRPSVCVQRCLYVSVYLYTTLSLRLSTQNINCLSFCLYITLSVTLSVHNIVCFLAAHDTVCV